MPTAQRPAQTSLGPFGRHRWPATDVPTTNPSSRTLYWEPTPPFLLQPWSSANLPTMQAPNSTNNPSPMILGSTLLEGVGIFKPMPLQRIGFTNDNKCNRNCSSCSRSNNCSSNYKRTTLSRYNIPTSFMSLLLPMSIIYHPCCNKSARVPSIPLTSPWIQRIPAP